MITLPPSLARHFRSPDGRTDYIRLLRTPDHNLVALAREMPEAEWEGLYTGVQQYRPGLLEQLAAAAAGVDTEAVRQRFLRVLEQAAPMAV